MRHRRRFSGLFLRVEGLRMESMSASVRRLAV